jgi:hypothetical protein
MQISARDFQVEGFQFQEPSLHLLIGHVLIFSLARKWQRCDRFSGLNIQVSLILLH